MRIVSAPGLRDEAFVDFEAISAWCMMYAALTSSLFYVLMRLASDTNKRFNGNDNVSREIDNMMIMRHAFGGILGCNGSAPNFPTFCCRSRTILEHLVRPPESLLMFVVTPLQCIP